MPRPVDGKVSQSLWIDEDDRRWLRHLALLANLSMDETARQVFLLGLVCFWEEVAFTLDERLQPHLRPETLRGPSQAADVLASKFINRLKERESS